MNTPKEKKSEAPSATVLDDLDVASIGAAARPSARETRIISRPFSATERVAKQIERQIAEFERMNKAAEQARRRADPFIESNRLAQQLEQAQRVVTEFERMNKAAEQARRMADPFMESNPLTREIRKAERPFISSASVETPLRSPEMLGKFIKTTRKSKHLSQQELADMAGVGRRFVSELENGKTTLEIGRVLKVCQALGVDLVARKR